MIGKGSTPEEAFEDVKRHGFVGEVEGKEYMVYVDVPKRKKTFKYITDMLCTNPLLRNPNGPVGCVLACSAEWVDERHIVEPEIQNEVVYLAYDAKGNELFSSSDKEQMITEGRKWASKHGTKVSIQKQIRITERVIECQATTRNNLNSYWFFGWAMA